MLIIAPNKLVIASSLRELILENEMHSHVYRTKQYTHMECVCVYWRGGGGAYEQ